MLFRSAERQVELLKSVVGACRNLRGEMSITPAAQVPLVATGAQSWWEQSFPYVRALAKISDLTLTATLPATDAPSAYVENMALMLKVEINVEEEIGRLGKEIAKLDKDIGRARTNLDNPSFVSRAPAQVLSQEKERLEKFTDIRTNLLNQFDRLNARKNNSTQPISSGNADRKSTRLNSSH